MLVHQRLCHEYGCPVGYFHELSPLDELVSSLLSHRTRNSESNAAYKELRKRFPDWVAVRDAPTADVLDAIKTCNWPEQKAPRIQQILRLVTERRGGELSLDFLEDMTVREARDWLELLPGVDRRRARRCSSSAGCGGARCRWTAITTVSRNASG